MSEANGTPLNPDAGDQDDMINMFTSVWVKVEVEETDPTIDDTPGIDFSQIKTRTKTPYKKPTKLIKCDQCNFTTYYKSCLVIHIKSRHNKEFLHCQQCTYTTSYVHCLARHMFVKHRPDDAVPPVMNGKQLTELHCHQCDYTTYFKWNLSAHQRKHKAVKEFKCEHCDYETAYRHHFIKHSKTHEEKHTVFYKCDKCPFVTRYTGHIQRHLAKIHMEVSESDSRCDHCNFSTKLRWRLNIHLQKSRQDAVLKCGFDQCDFKTYYKCQLKMHKTSHYGDMYVHKYRPRHLQSELNEDVDSKPAANSSQNMEHDGAENSNDPAGAVQSPKGMTGNSYAPNPNQTILDAAKTLTELTAENFRSIENLVQNTSRNLTKEPAEYIPRNLNQIPFEHPSKTLTQNYLSMTMTGQSSHSDETLSEQTNKSMPSNCTPEKTRKPNGEGFCNKYELDPNCSDFNTIQVLESSDKSKPFQCFKCEYTAKFKASVQRHFQRHHTGNVVRPYRCCNCDFSTKTKDQIGLHNKRSLSDTQIVCPDCNFTTFFKCQFVLHQKSHYKFHCTMCPYSSRKQTDLTRHYAVHHLGNGIQCRFCDFKAVRKDSVLCHETIHTGVKPFQCDFCDHTSVRKSLLKRHTTRYHSDQQQKVATVVSSSEIQSKIDKLKFKVPIIHPSETASSSGTAIPISDERISLSENRVLVGNSLVTIEDKDQISGHSVTSLIGMIGMNMAE